MPVASPYSLVYKLKESGMIRGKILQILLSNLPKQINKIYNLILTFKIHPKINHHEKDHFVALPFSYCRDRFFARHQNKRYYLHQPS